MEGCEIPYTRITYLTIWRQAAAISEMLTEKTINDTLVAINIFENSCVGGFDTETPNSGCLHEKCINIHNRWMRYCSH